MESLESLFDSVKIFVLILWILHSYKYLRFNGLLRLLQSLAMTVRSSKIALPCHCEILHSRIVAIQKIN